MPIERNGRALRTWVGSFQSMKQALRELMAADLVICSACDQPAKHIDFQDAAEWFCHCPDHHYGFGEQWTGSTRFQPHLLWVAVFPDRVDAWLAALPDAERAQWKLESYDTRNLYDLMGDDFRSETRTVVKTDNYECYVDLYPLTTGEFAYTIGQSWGSWMNRRTHEYGLVGTFASEAEAMQHAMQDPDMPTTARRQADAPPEANSPI